MTRTRVGIIYGGRSGEHEVSVASAASIFTHLDPARFDAVPIRIDKDGCWRLGAPTPTARSAGAVCSAPESAAAAGTVVEPTSALRESGIDVVFPVLHGPYGEDGTIQGLLELGNVPYVGAGVLGSAVGMDKAVMKKLFAAHDLPIVPSLTAVRREWVRDRRGLGDRVSRELRYPVFVKPANLGSSVGISKARSPSELETGVDLALQFDRKIVIEAAVPNAREIECAVLGNDDPEASVPGEVIPSREFYDYESKYLDDSSTFLIPAPLTEAQATAIRRMSVDAFRALDCAGMARVDFLMARESGDLFLNEVNTIPGFTTISMYPKMWEASGLPYPALLERLIALAFERHTEKQQLRTSI